MNEEINFIKGKCKCPYITGRLECLIGAFGNADCITESHKTCEHKLRHENLEIKRREFVKNQMN